MQWNGGLSPSDIEKLIQDENAFRVWLIHKITKMSDQLSQLSNDLVLLKQESNHLKKKYHVCKKLYTFLLVMVSALQDII